MFTITMSKSELLALKDALDLEVSLSTDACIDALYVDNNQNVVSFDTVNQMRKDVQDRVQHLVKLVKLLERVTTLSEL